jgi:hypothetical protein
VAATRLLGIPQDTETGVVRDMVRSFVQQAKGLEGWKGLDGECAVQGAVDLGFLNLISGDKPIDPTVEGLLAKVSLLVFCQVIKLIIRPLHRSPPTSGRIYQRS